MNYYLGIDIGTSGTKTVCFDSTGKALMQVTKEYQMKTPRPQYAEEDPENWLNATLECIKEVAYSYPRIEGIGLSGQMHGLVILDKDDNVLRDSIIWCDNRTKEEAIQIEKKLTNKKVKEITGNDIMPAFTLAKLLWVKNNEPEIYDNIAKIMLPKDYIRYMLTGEFKTEYSDASGMQMVNIKNKEYSKEILDAFDIDINKLPKLVESTDKTGYLKENYVKLCGLLNVPFLVGGAGDQAAQAVGNGIINLNDVSIVLGSSGVVFSPIKKEQIDATKLQVFMHAVPNMYHVMGVTNGCGLSYKWYKEHLCDYEIEKANDNNKNVYDILNLEAESSKPLANGLIYLPYLNGERTPHLDVYATGTFVGIKQNTSKNDFTRSILEGVAFSLKDCYKLLDKPSKNVLVSGGGANGKLWREIIASTLNASLYRISESEGGCLGVAILAMVCNKEYETIEEACKNIIITKDITKPNKNDVKTYKTGHILYTKLYKSLKKYYKLAYEIGGIK